MVEIYEPAGVDVSRTHTTPQFKLGTVAKGEQGREYVYCKSSGTHAQYALVAIDEDFTSRSATTTIASEAAGPGWPQIAFATDVYGWIATKGRGLFGKLKDGVAANAQLATSASVGIMAATGSAGSPNLLIGVRVAVAGSGAGNPGEIIAINPSFKLVATGGL